MPPATMSRMHAHASHLSNPFASLNPQQSHYQPASGFTSQHVFGGTSPFPTTSYGVSAFAPGAGGSLFNGTSLGQGQGLASMAAQQGFARGAAMQDDAAAMDVKSTRIRPVWQYNLEQEMVIMRKLITKYTIISMDTEFPGIIARPIGTFAGSKAEYHYQTLRCNVDLLRPVQLGITLWTPEGELPSPHPDPAVFNGKHPYNNLMCCPCTWVFNFKFNLTEDMFSEPSIALLESNGVEFDKHRDLGIEMDAFGAALTTSGLVFSDDVHWLSFHSGYDYGYLVKLLTSNGLPEDQIGFFNIVKTFFPRLYDLKTLLRHAQRLHTTGRLSPDASRIISDLGQRSGLQDLADALGVTRIGQIHTGGSDSYVTGAVFWAMKMKIFNNDLPEDLADQIYGLHGVGMPASQQYRDEFFAAQGAATPQQQTNGLHNPSTPTNSHAALQHTLSLGTAFGGFQSYAK